MRRTVLTLGGTVAGLAALFSFKTHSLAGTSALDTPTTPSGAAATPPVTPTRSAAGMQTSAGTPMATQTRTVTGTVASTQYGPMQVQVTLAGTRITNVTVLQRTDDGAMSNEVDSFALPKLTAETITAQSARIDAVSGASYTSSGYIQSLQSAVDQAGL